MRYYVRITVNGRVYEDCVPAGMTLLTFIRDRAGLTGATEGCGRGECGACTVLLDGVPVRSCIILAVEADGAVLETVEALAAADGRLHPLQAELIGAAAVQCGCCTPGVLMAGKALYDKGSRPAPVEVAEALQGHLCRCGGYKAIHEAIAAACRRNPAGG